VWVNVRFLNKRGEVVREHGRYDESSATLDSGSTTVFEMHVGLSASAALGTVYADGQHWADVDFAIPPGAVRADARLYYQSTPRE
jgi:hypothetical protein